MFPPAGASQNEQTRLARLRGLDILDSHADPVFDALVSSASAICGAPVALVSLIDEHRQWFKANIGLPGVTETERDVAFCSHAIESDELFEIPDATLDPRFASNPLVCGSPNIRFYAGAPIRLEDGHRIGTLCVIDKQPRHLNAMQREALQALAQAAASAIEGQRALSLLAASEAEFRTLSECSPLGIFRTDADGRCIYTNPAWQAIYGLSGVQAAGDGWTATLHPLDRAAVAARWQDCARDHGEFDMQFRILRSAEDARQVHVRAQPVIDNKGRMSGYVGSVSDITEPLRMTQRLMEQRNRLHSILEGTNVGTWEWDVQTDELVVNERWAELIGYTLEELAPTTITTWKRVTHPNDLERASALIERHFRGEIDYYDCEIRMRHKEGHWVWLHDRGRVALRDAAGQPLKMMGTHTDISSRVANAEALRESHCALERTGKIAHVGGWSINLASGRLDWSEATCRVLDLPPGTHMTVVEALRAYAPSSREAIAAALEAAQADGTPWDLEAEMVTAGGRSIWTRVSGEVEFENGLPARLVGALQDITRRYAAEQELLESRELLQVTLESIGDAVITTDVECAVTWMNPVAEKLTGWARTDASGRPIREVFEIVHEESRATVENPVYACLTQGRTVELADRTMLIARDKVEYGIQDSASPIRGRDGLVLGAVLVFHDVSDQRRLNQAMQHRATHDSLTGLINRAEFEHRLKRVFDHAQSAASINALMYIDLDQFKIVNDSCGHRIGDQLLKQVSELLSQCVRKRDTLARLGGDEFGVILEHCSVEQAERVAQQICDEMNEFRFDHDVKRYRIGASIGLVPISDASSSEAAVLQAADSACFAAKDSGRNRVHTWRDTDQSMAVRKGEMRWANRIEQAIDDDRFVLYGQRIASTNATSSKGHCEILLRMRGTGDAIIPPGAFLPAAERYHLASRLDRWVFCHVFEFMNGQGARLDALDTIAVNLSGQSIGDPEFLRFVAGLLPTARFDVRKLCFEITETAVITHIDAARHFIREMRALGIRIALDDFGAGASSFGYLKSLPVDYLKIDGQFIRNILDNPLDLVAVRCFIEVARVIGIETIAEFVENAQILAKIEELGVDFAQGYLVHRPEPIEQVLSKLHTQHASSSPISACGHWAAA